MLKYRKLVYPNESREREREREEAWKPKERTLASFMVFAFKVVRDYCVNKSNLEYKDLDIRLTRITNEHTKKLSSYFSTK